MTYTPMTRSFALFTLVLLFSSSCFAFESKAKYAILLDYNTSTVLYEKNSDQTMKPSSMTKLMTAYVVFDYLKKGIFKLEDKIGISEKAWRKGGSKMFINYNDRVSIHELLLGMIVQSGNDASIALAEGIADSEEAFAELMNQKAEEIGLTGSNFKNVTGWPEDNHVMTAQDVALLSQRLIEDFPSYYHYFSQTEYTYSNITQKNRNLLLFRDIGADGLKTGHTEDAGYGLAATALRGGRRVIAVVNGLSSDAERANVAEDLLEYGFRYFQNETLFKKGQVVGEAKIWFGKQDTVPLILGQDITITLPKLKKEDASFEIMYNGPLPAPIETGNEVAQLVVNIPELKKITIPLFAEQPVEKAPWYSALVKKFKYYTFGEV